MGNLGGKSPDATVMVVMHNSSEVPQEFVRKACDGKVEKVQRTIGADTEVGTHLRSNTKLIGAHWTPQMRTPRIFLGLYPLQGHTAVLHLVDSQDRSSWSSRGTWNSDPEMVWSVSESIQFWLENATPAVPLVILLSGIPDPSSESASRACADARAQFGISSVIACPDFTSSSSIDSALALLRSELSLPPLFSC